MVAKPRKQSARYVTIAQAAELKGKPYEWMRRHLLRLNALRPGLLQKTGDGRNGRYILTLENLERCDRPDWARAEDNRREIQDLDDRVSHISDEVDELKQLMQALTRSVDSIVEELRKPRPPPSTPVHENRRR